MRRIILGAKRLFIVTIHPVSANLVSILWCICSFYSSHIGMDCRYPGYMGVKLRIAIPGPGFRQSLAE